MECRYIGVFVFVLLFMSLTYCGCARARAAAPQHLACYTSEGCPFCVQLERIADPKKVTFYKDVRAGFPLRGVPTCFVCPRGQEPTGKERSYIGLTPELKAIVS